MVRVTVMMKVTMRTTVLMTVMMTTTMKVMVTADAQGHISR